MLIMFQLPLQGIEGVGQIRDGYNPATWALEVTNGSNERRLGVDFADVYESSSLYKCVPSQASSPKMPGAPCQMGPCRTLSYTTMLMRHRACLCMRAMQYSTRPVLLSAVNMPTCELVQIALQAHGGAGGGAQRAARG